VSESIPLDEIMPALETPMRFPFRSILAATDLGCRSDVIVRSAAILAQRSGAELHLLHSLELPRVPSNDVIRRTGFFGQIETAEERLRDQVERTMPEGVRPASQKVIIYIAHNAILDRAQEVSADLIVVGPHRSGAAGAHFLGTTTDRVVRTASVPCLVVKEPLPDAIRRIGVPVNFSDPSQGALETALAWGVQLAQESASKAAGAVEVRVMYVGWPLEQADNPDVEAETILPELNRQLKRSVSWVAGAEFLDTRIEVLWADNPTEATLRWAESADIDLLVMGTHGRSGLRHGLIGSMASSVARQTTRPALLVPPALWSGHAHTPRLERVMVATDFSDASLGAARWSARELAPGAEHLLVHVLEIPEPPSLLTGSFGPRAELVRTARVGAEGRLGVVRIALTNEGADAATVRTEVHEGQPAEQIVRLADDMDLVVMGARGRSDVKRGSWTMLGATVERVLRASPAPVLVTRGLAVGPPRRVLAAVDGSEPSLRALSWAEFLRDRFGGSLEVLYVEAASPYGYPAVVPLGSEAGHPAEGDPAQPAGWLRKREDWLRGQVRHAGIDPETVQIQVIIGSPVAEIVAQQNRSRADLIVIGTHGRGTLGRALLGSVASAVLRAASCSVLAVGEPGLARG